MKDASLDMKRPLFFADKPYVKTVTKLLHKNADFDKICNPAKMNHNPEIYQI